MDEQKKKWAISGAVAILILIGYWYFAYRGQDVKITELNVQIEDLTRKVNEAKVQAARLEELQKEMVVLEAQWKSALKYLPTQDEIEVMLHKIDDAMNDAHLKSVTFTPGEPEAQEFYSEQAIRMSVQGFFPDFLSFLDRLERFDRIIQPQLINIKLKQAGADKPTDGFLLDISFTLVTYIQGETIES